MKSYGVVLCDTLISIVSTIVTKRSQCIVVPRYRQVS